MGELILEGCRPVPLAHYLKALGVLRLVADQADPTARGFWNSDRFVLQTQMEREELLSFFLDRYRPTPLTGPWNGGSGYFDKDNTKALDALRESQAERFGSLRETIDAAKGVLARLGLAEKPNSDQKGSLLRACRATFPDEALRWLDATFVLSDDGAKYPPLLGTGGNDGRLEFTNNYMQRLVSLFEPTTGKPEPNARALLEASLFADLTTDLVKGAPIGQFLPGSAGGVNATSGFGADSLINSWDFILMLEGATLFGAAAARCLEQDTAGLLSYPFTVRAAGVGYESAGASDEASARAEMWLPLWGRAASLPELSSLLSEGRARVGGRAARDGVDFARAVAGLGVDRGIDAFQRFGFHVRNGLSYFAVPIGRFSVRAEPRTELLNEIDGWMDRFRGRASGQTAPASAARALHLLEERIFELCQRGDVSRQQAVLIALGQCERVLAKSQRWTIDSFLHPVPALSGQWLRDCDDGSVEYRLAASLASVWGYYDVVGEKRRLLSIRGHFEPVAAWRAETGLMVRWNWESSQDVVWSQGHVVDSMNATMQRRLVRAVRAGTSTHPDVGHVAAALGDITDFISGAIDEQKFVDLLWGCLLIDWTRTSLDQHPAPRAAPSESIGALYAVLKLCFAGNADSRKARAEGDSTVIPVVPRIHREAASGDAPGAATEALRRLRGSGFAPALKTVHSSARLARRTAAALLFPISQRTKQELTRLVLRPAERPSSHSSDALNEGPSS